MLKKILKMTGSSVMTVLKHFKKENNIFFVKNVKTICFVRIVKKLLFTSTQ